mgnify:CR=1 FL=1
MTEINELTPTLVNSLIERIEVHNNDKSSGHCYVKVYIYFTAVCMIDIPTENEILATMEEIRENPQNFIIWRRQMRTSFFALKNNSPLKCVPY